MPTVLSVLFLAAFTALPSVLHGQRAPKPLVSHHATFRVDTGYITPVPMAPNDASTKSIGRRTVNGALVGAGIGTLVGLVVGSQFSR